VQTGVSLPFRVAFSASNLTALFFSQLYTCSTSHDNSSVVYTVCAKVGVKLYTHAAASSTVALRALCENLGYTYTQISGPAFFGFPCKELQAVLYKQEQRHRKKMEQQTFDETLAKLLEDEKMHALIGTDDDGRPR
jgi:hypothetical protein